jgi:DNA-directed RNA polymerase specialized sigma24 family protein
MINKNRLIGNDEKILSDLRALKLTSLWLTKNGPASKELVRNTLSRFYESWRPQISRAEVKVTLFKILTNLFFNGIPRKKIIPIVSPVMQKLNQVASRLRLFPARQNNVALRTLVRLPIEIKFVKILSNLGGFSPSEIAEIIGVTWGGIEVKPVAGSMLLHGKAFIYGGDD